MATARLQREGDSEAVEKRATVSKTLTGEVVLTVYYFKVYSSAQCLSVRNH